MSEIDKIVSSGLINNVMKELIFIPQDIHHEEVARDLDRLHRRYLNNIRGLREVKTNEKGERMIQQSRDSMNDLYEWTKAYIADLEWRNILIHVYLTRIGFQNEQMKHAINLKDSSLASLSDTVDALIDKITQLQCRRTDTSM